MLKIAICDDDAGDREQIAETTFDTGFSFT